MGRGVRINNFDRKWTRMDANGGGNGLKGAGRLSSRACRGIWAFPEAEVCARGRDVSTALDMTGLGTLGSRRGPSVSGLGLELPEVRCPRLEVRKDPFAFICVHLRLFLVLGAEKTARNGLGRAEWGGHLGASGLNRRRGVREAETCRAGARKSGPAFWAGPRGGRGGNS